MRPLAAIGLLILLLMIPGHTLGHPHILRLADNTPIGFEEMLNELAGARVIFFGEYHNHFGHHQAQLELIRALHEKGKNVAVGLEMFRRNHQYALDRWVEGKLSEEEFLPIYLDNWRMWPEYSEIFRFAQAEKIKLVGLNISREITRQVARSGVASLKGEQLEALEGISCRVSKEYQDYLRSAMGGHGGRGTSFDNFCEAQMVWDISMARNLADYLVNAPETTVVVLAGTVHSWKHGIPTQIQQFIDIPWRVVMPEIPGQVDRTTGDESTADFLWLDYGPTGWHVSQSPF